MHRLTDLVASSESTKWPRSGSWLRTRHGVFQASTRLRSFRRRLAEPATGPTGWDLVLPIPLSKQCTCHSRPGVGEWLQKPDLGGATVYVDGSSMSRFLLSRRSCQKACGSCRQGEDKARVQCHRQRQPGHLNRGRRHRGVATAMLPHCVAPEYSQVLVHKRRCAALNNNHFITDVVQTTPRGLGTQRCSPTPWPTYGHGHERMHGNGTSCTRT